MATTSDAKVTPGTGNNIATYDITEDGETKKLQRVVIADNAGADKSLALETGGNLATIVTNTGRIPAQGQALAAASLPVVLPVAQITTLTPPAAITGFATATLQGGGLPAALGAGGGLKIDGSGTALPVSGTVTANAGTNLNTSLLALESGGNLATIAGAVSSSKVATKSASGDFADGAIATLGTKADAKSTATDTTAITAMQVLKQISASVQAPPSQAVTNAGTFAVQAAVTAASGSIASGAVASGAFASGALASGSVASGAIASGAMVDLGAIADAAVTAGATGSVSAKLRSISRDIVANIVLAAGSNIIGKVGIDQTTVGTTDSVTVKSQGFKSAQSVTRPANTTAYTANDVLGASAAAITFSSLAPTGGGEILIKSTELEIDVTAIPSGMTSFRLYLYNVTPPSALADNAAWDLPSGDRASFMGYVDLGSPVDLGSTLYVRTNAVDVQVTATGTSVFGYLVTNGGFTPAANSEVYKVTLHAVAL